MEGLPSYLRGNFPSIHQRVSSHTSPNGADEIRAPGLGGTRGVSSGLAPSAQHGSCPPAGIYDTLAQIVGEETRGVTEVGRWSGGGCCFRLLWRNRASAVLAGFGGVGGEGWWGAREGATDQVVLRVQDGEGGSGASLEDGSAEVQLQVAVTVQALGWPHSACPSLTTDWLATHCPVPHLYKRG